MMRRKIVALFFMTSLTGCAAVHNGQFAAPVEAGQQQARGTPTKAGLLISGRVDNDLSSEYFGFVDLTFENCSNDWIRIKTMKLSLGSEAKDQRVYVVSGREIWRWFEAMTRKNEIDRHNRAVAATTLGIVGAVAGAASGERSSGRALGAIALLGANTYLVGTEIDRVISRLETASICDQSQGAQNCAQLPGGEKSMTIAEAMKTAVPQPGSAPVGPTAQPAQSMTAIFPDSHLLGDYFFVPPGLFTKKWVLFNSRNLSKSGDIDSLRLEYETVNGEKEQVVLSLRPEPAQTRDNVKTAKKANAKPQPAKSAG